MVDGAQRFGVRQKPVRDRIRTRYALGGLLAQPIDRRFDVGGLGAGADDADAVTQRRRSPTSSWRSVGRMCPNSTYRAASTCVSFG
jgi:hypothetical protein